MDFSLRSATKRLRSSASSRRPCAHQRADLLGGLVLGGQRIVQFDLDGLAAVVQGDDLFDDGRGVHALLRQTACGGLHVVADLLDCKHSISRFLNMRVTECKNSKFGTLRVRAAGFFLRAPRLFPAAVRSVLSLFRVPEAAIPGGNAPNFVKKLYLCFIYGKPSQENRRVARTGQGLPFGRGRRGLRG